MALTTNVTSIRAVLSAIYRPRLPFQLGEAQLAKSGATSGAAAASISASSDVSKWMGNRFLGAVTLKLPTRSLQRAFVCLSSPSVTNSAAGSSAKSPETITFYVHEKRTPPDLTLVSTAEPTGGPLEASKLKFGTVFLYDNIIRDTESADGAVLGSETGLVGFTRDNKSFYMTQVFSLKTPTGSGSLALQGRFDPTTTSELVITGGTGDFRFARGYATSNVVLAASAADQSLVVFKFEVTLNYD